MNKKVFLVPAAFLVAAVIVLSGPSTTSDPAASPADRAKEDLSRFVYPSLAHIKWKPHFVMPDESLERLFGKDWVYVARLNRIDRRHVYPGMTIKVPEDMEAVKNYNPLPLDYGPAEKYPRYVLVDLEEQWLAAYEYGVQKFSMPAATGIEGHETPKGMFKVEAHHKTHSSSLYKTPKGDIQYPMDYAVRFLIDSQSIAYWIHARDMPGRPASHGCIGVYDEEMQKRVYRWPETPVINDAARLYHWVYDESDEDETKVTLISNGPPVEIRGNLPKYLDAPPGMR